MSASDLDLPTGLLVVLARRSIRQAICARARRHRLTSQQFWAVVVLQQQPGVTTGDLGARLLLDPPAASRLVATLAERKLLEVRPDREDRRRTRLHLSPAGLVLAEKVRNVADEFHAAVARGLSATELETVRAGLRRITENLAAFEVGGEEAPAARRASGA